MPEVEDFVVGLGAAERAVFLDCAAAGRFLSASVAIDGWHAPELLTSSVVLTDAGQSAVERLGVMSGDDFAQADIYAAILCVLGSDEIYIDLSATDTEAIFAALSPCFVANDLQLVWSYGHVFLERLSAAVQTLPEDGLDPIVSRRVLAGVPQAVAQVGPVVAGRFGLCRSTESRWFPPRLVAGPVPCTDPGCDYLHAVRFAGVTSDMHLAEAFFLDELEAEFGGSDHWLTAVDEITQPQSRYLDEFHTGSLPLTLSNAFSERELRAILADLIDHYSAAIRPTVSRCPQLTTLFRASGTSIADQLDTAGLVQVLLLTTDRALIEAIEYAIDAGHIAIPPTEVRTVMYGRGDLDTGFFRVHAEVSRQGVALHPDRGQLQQNDLSLLRLQNLVREAHSAPRDVEDLAWRLSTLVQPESRDPLGDYLRAAHPADAVEELLFKSREILEASFRLMRYGRFWLPASRDELVRMRDRVLWKLGFAVPSYPSALATFWERLEGLRRAADDAPEPFGETTQERLRGEGVNLFVSTEEILDLALSFTGWALLSDHYGRPALERFRFDLDEARSTTAGALNGRSIGENDVLEIRRDGKNPLFPLVEGFRVLGEYCDELLAADASAYRRDDDKSPFFAGKSPLTFFPFVHTVTLFDLSPEPRAKLIERLKEVPSAIGRGHVLDVRNRLEHQRDSFPTASELAGALDALEAVIQDLEMSGCCPTVFQLVRIDSDRYGRSTSILQNYSGATVELYTPSSLHLDDLPGPAEPQVCLRGVEITGSGEDLRFVYAEPSDFQRLWRRFPRGEVATARVETGTTKVRLTSHGDAGGATARGELRRTPRPSNGQGE